MKTLHISKSKKGNTQAMLAAVKKANRKRKGLDNTKYSAADNKALYRLEFTGKIAYRKNGFWINK